VALGLAALGLAVFDSVAVEVAALEVLEEAALEVAGPVVHCSRPVRPVTLPQSGLRGMHRESSPSNNSFSYFTE
jgi:hypothetical protein